MHAQGTSRGSRARPWKSTLLVLSPVVLPVVLPVSVAAQRTERDSSALTLTALLTDVLARHPLIHAGGARIRAARAARSTAGALSNPVLAYEVENAPLPGRAVPDMEREDMLLVGIPLAPLYQRWPAVAHANAELRAAEAEALAQRQQTARDATRAFYRAAAAQIAVETRSNVVAWLDSVATYNRVRVAEGAAAEADLIRAQLERDRAAAELTIEQAELIRARFALRAFLSTPTGAAVAFDSVTLSVPAGLGLSPAELRRLMQRRPDVGAATQRYEAARAGVGVERTMVLREVDATIGVKQSAGTTSLIAGASVPFPLFNWNRGEIRRAAAERDAAQFELVATERSAHAEIAAAYESARLLTERAAALGPAVLERAEEARRITLGAYQEGAVPLIQVLDAARAWADVRVAYFETLFAQHESVIELLLARGDDPAVLIDLEPNPPR